MKKLPKKDRIPDSKRFSILTKDMHRCFVCGAFAGIQKHEIFGGTGRRELSKYYGLVVPLCDKCHAEVHKKEDFAGELKRRGQEAFEEHYPDEEFLEVFGRNYL